MSFGSGPSSPRPHRRVIHAASALLSTNCSLEPSQPGVGLSHQSHYPRPLHGLGACATVAQVSLRGQLVPQPLGPSGGGDGPQSWGWMMALNPSSVGPLFREGAGCPLSLVCLRQCMPACHYWGWCKPQRVPRAHPAMRGTGQAAMLLSVATLPTGNQPLEKEAWLFRALEKKQ